MAKKKYYAVKKGKTPGIYLTWEDCKAQTEGFSGAIYKSFPTLEQAEQYVEGESSQDDDSPREEKTKAVAEENCAVAYVDGSFNVATGDYSCGVVFLYQGQEETMAEKGKDEELAQMRNVAGEILGSQLAMEHAIALGIKKIKIVHDYQGIASWCLGEWKTNKEGTRAYKQFYDSIKDRLEVQFVKVTGHSGDYYNDRADELAKSVIF
ncbi:MAG: ribonuclease H family protein [Eubacterium sp.]|nr:ribonuclease H family protein [Eubacterium sp.]